MQPYRPIGIFDSGFGGLTVFKEIKEHLPGYDYLYFGDNARAPYGNSSLDVVYEFTLECVEWMFANGCPLVILACNTASAEALRMIQQNDLERFGPDKKVLGVIRPTAEIIGEYTHSNAIGVLATVGTVESDVYPVEIKDFYPGVTVYQHACPIWAPLVESGEYKTEAAGHFIKQDIDALMVQNPQIDTILLGCTHYPILIDRIRKFVPGGVRVISQGEIVAKSLVDYLERHPEIEQQLTRNNIIRFYTTDSPESFNKQATSFFEEPVHAEQVHLHPHS